MNTSSEATDFSASQTRYTVLIVDDEEYILQALRRLFHRESYAVLIAASGAEGLELLAATADVAVIISDQRMPEMDGSAFLAHSRKLAPEAIRMLLTGHSDVEATVAAMNEGGATRYIRKPWEDLELLQTVRDGVRQYYLVSENNRQQRIINQQHAELSSWNTNLKSRVLAQTAQIRKKVEELQQLNGRQLKNFEGMIESLAALLELRSPKSRSHSARTAALSMAVAQSVGLPAEQVEEIRIAALLHDIGKTSLSDRVLVMDEADFSAAEMHAYRRHPVLGQTAIDSLQDLRSVGILIRHHHERFDGAGFPDGLQGSAIPRGAAIIALADCLDLEIARHLGSNAVDCALKAMATQAGSAFAPDLLSHLARPAHQLYDRQKSQEAGEMVELEVEPRQLKEGMLLTQDLYSRSGLFLLEAWTALDRDKIRALQRIFSLDPKPGGIAVGIGHPGRLLRGGEAPAPALSPT